MLFWPTLVAGGFLLLNGLVIALAASSTARFEFDRNRVREHELAAAVSVRAGTGGAASGSTPASGAQEAAQQRSVAVSVAAHPAGKAVGAAGSTAGSWAAAAGWWLVADSDVDPAPASGGHVLAGPFADRVEAEWAALSEGLEALPVHGVHDPARGLVRRPCPEDRAWLDELGKHLDRLDDDWTELVTDGDALTTLVVELTAVLVEAGVSLHDGTGNDPAGGACLTPAPGLEGILVSWQPHERMSMHHGRGPAVAAAVHRTLNAALADLLAELGFAVEPFGSTSCYLVRG